MSLKVDEKHGVVKMPFTKYKITFEAIETIYKRIKPLLGKRRKAKIVEGASR